MGLKFLAIRFQFESANRNNTAESDCVVRMGKYHLFHSLMVCKRKNGHLHVGLWLPRISVSSRDSLIL